MLTRERTWARPGWERRLRWQRVVAVALVALGPAARRRTAGPLAGVASAAAWALRADASPALQWQTVAGWLQRSVLGDFTDALLAAGD